MPTTRLVALFTLKPGVSAAAYEAWARSVDLPTVNGLPSIADFQVFKAVSVLGSSAAPPYQYVEIIDVRDMEQFGADVATPLMSQIASQFQGMVDVTFLLTEQLDWPGQAA
jgi:hypothetical protein